MGLYILSKLIFYIYNSTKAGYAIFFYGKLMI